MSKHLSYLAPRALIKTVGLSKCYFFFKLMVPIILSQNIINFHTYVKK